jgi:hypothetical protein
MAAPGFYRDAPGPLNLLLGQISSWMGKREGEIGRLMYEEVEGLVEDKSDCDIMLSVNTTESYRRAKNARLYVPRAPHQVRPFSHTGAQYWLDGPDGIEVSLNDPVEKQEYQRDSVRFRSGHQLCLACRDMFNYYCKYRETRIPVSHEINQDPPTSLKDHCSTIEKGKATKEGERSQCSRSRTLWSSTSTFSRCERLWR